LDAELLNTTVDALLNSQDIEAAADSALLLLDVDKLTADGQAALADWLLRDDASLRTISSARTPLDELADQGRFRLDLALALSTLAIHLPPLDQRREDIPLLAQAFLEEANQLGGRQLGGFSEDAFDRLIDYCPDYAEGYNQRAFVNFLREDFAAALVDLDLALERRPRHVAAMSGKALTLMGLGRHDEAQEILREAVKLNPWIPEAGLLQGEEL